MDTDTTTTYNPYKVALQVQDACNLRALAREFVKVVDAANGNCDDAAVIMFVSKFESMVQPDVRFNAAYDTCLERLGDVLAGDHA